MPEAFGSSNFPAMKLAVKIVAALILLIIAGGGIFFWWLSGSLPQTEGNLTLAGLTAEVTVARDEHGIPHITAHSEADALFALGFVHAQDRLWQMEMQRRIGAGRLAEILGPSVLNVDRFIRTLGLYRLAQQSVEELAPDTRRAVDAYIAGVNAFITTHKGALPPEFVMLRITPEPWKPADVLIWGKLMTLQLSYNWRDELVHARALETLPADEAADLWPGYPTTQPTTIGLSQTFLDHMLAAIPDPLLPRLASNEWVVSGAHSVTGKPLLANDPHLDFQAPILWYLASISAPGLELDGATVPGTPFLILGHNTHIAWGMTTTTSDTEDLFIEKAEGTGYSTPDGPKPFIERQEIIKIHGAPDSPITIRETRHGPVISDVLGRQAEGRILALSSSALQPDDLTAQALYRVSHAANWQEFLDALREFHAPQQNIAYADGDGHIGWIAPGLVPLRAKGDGTLPQPGWTGEFDWKGWIPFSGLPQILDPPSGIIVNANNKPVPDSYPYLLAATWPEGYRAQRITQLLEQTPRLDAAAMGRMQMDELSPMAVELKPLMMRTPPSGPKAEAAYALLRDWDGTTSRDRPEPLIFESWIGHLQRDIVGLHMGPAGAQFTSLKPLFIKAVLEGRTLWCAAPGQPAPPNCDALVAKALDETLDELGHVYGEDMKSWRWGKSHIAEFDALLFGHIPLLDRLTGISASTGGDGFTIQRGAFDGPSLTEFHHKHGAGLRAVYDLADLEASRFMIATGQSGNPLSSHWSDLLHPWLRGDAIRLGRDAKPNQSLTLLPAR